MGKARQLSWSGPSGEERAIPHESTVRNTAGSVLLADSQATTPEAAQPESAQLKSARPELERHGGLLLIGLFKLAKSIFFFAVGMGALHLLHKDLGDVAMKLAVALGRDPEGHLVTLLMEKVDLITAQRLREIGFGTFAYSVLALIEGYGLTRERVWAEYLTLSLTVLFLPWELYELARDPTWLRMALLAINLLVLVYLVVLLQRKRRASGTATF